MLYCTWKAQAGEGRVGGMLAGSDVLSCMYVADFGIFQAHSLIPLRRNSPDATASITGMRSTQTFSEAGILHCRSGNMALKGNMPDKARTSFQAALSSDPMLWEAFEGLCSMGGSIRVS